MPVGGFTTWEWLVLFQHELLLFAAVFFLIGAIDELAVDLSWLYLKVTGRARTEYLPDNSISASPQDERLSGPVAVFIPTWQESAVIGTTIRHALLVWPHAQLRLYVGCYRNDPATIAAVAAAAAGDPRLRIVIHDRIGPSTKADCLNRLYRALRDDERALDITVSMIVLHDAEDMVDPAALALIDAAMVDADLVQIPVLPVPQAGSTWVAGHYCEEFAEAHGKAMPVRDALAAGMPLAGVGCAISRAAVARLASAKPDGNPFATDCLTEDYELGLGVAQQGGRARFVRKRHADGRLIATRAYFPARLDQAVRQKTRWIHGIAFQGWDRLGWDRRPAETWMRLRDRRGPFTALVLAIAYLLLVVSAIVWGLAAVGGGVAPPLSPLLKVLLALNFASFAWRAAWRFAFTAREYGWREGIMAVLRIPVANIIAIMAARRAVMSYVRSLGGTELHWDKTEHTSHPVNFEAARSPG